MDYELAAAYATGMEPPPQAFAAGQHPPPNSQRQQPRRRQHAAPMDEDGDFGEEVGELPVVDDLEVAAAAAAAAMEALGGDESSSSSSSDEDSDSDASSSGEGCSGRCRRLPCFNAAVSGVHKPTIMPPHLRALCGACKPACTTQPQHATPAPLPDALQHGNV